MAEPHIIVVPGHSVSTQSWWETLHSTINTSFQNKDFQAFPDSWTRLPSDSKEGAQRLQEELGLDGVIAVVFHDVRPIACAGAVPFRGLNWIADVKSAEEESHVASGELTTTQKEAHLIPADPNASPSSGSSPDWEICCMCIHPDHRRIALSPKLLETLQAHLRTLGVKRLFTNYVIEETGRYWPRMGFETVPGAGGVLKKGFTHTKGMPGLRADIHFAMGIKTI